MLALDGEVAKHGVVEAEAVFDFSQGFVAAFDVEEKIVSLQELFDWVSQWTAAPVFDAVDLTAFFSDLGLVAPDHSWNLFALIRVHNNAKFVVTQLSLLAEKAA